jgi:hypothetical protein
MFLRWQIAARPRRNAAWAFCSLATMFAEP